MKIKYFKALFLVFAAFCLAFTHTSCSKKTGCPINEDAHVKTGKDGSYKDGKAHSGLFPDKAKKRRKKGRDNR